MKIKYCRDCRKPFEAYMTIQTRCGDCHYKYNLELAKNSRKIEIKKHGKHRKLWSKAKQLWLKDNPPADDLYYCFYCGLPLTINPDLLSIGVEQLTLDHVNARSSHPELRYVNQNLIPCCYSDNSKKGSMSYEQFCKLYYPEKLTAN